jgi:hypothetical protein
MTYSCGESASNAEEADMGVTWNGSATQVSASGKLFLRRWVDLNLVAKWNEGDATMDIDFHIGEFELDITVPGNPFHQKKDTDIIFGKGIHAFVLNMKIFNQNLPKIEFDRFRWEPDFDFNFSLPVCNIGQFLFGDACSDCDPGCEVCEGSADNCAGACFDLECSSCDDSSEGSACHDCSGNGLA